MRQRSICGRERYRSGRIINRPLTPSASPAVFPGPRTASSRTQAGEMRSLKTWRAIRLGRPRHPARYLTENILATSETLVRRRTVDPRSDWRSDDKEDTDAFRHDVQG